VPCSLDAGARESFAIGAARQREAVGPREGLEEVRVLRDGDLEALARELARGDALDEGVREAGVGQIAVAAPELRRRPAHDASPSAARSGCPRATRNMTLFPAACGEKNSVTSSSKNVSPVAPKRWA